MPSLDKTRLFRSVRRVPTPQITNYEIIRDSSFIGQKVKINWDYSDVNIVGFRVWRAVSKKVLLKKNYLVPQAAFERMTGLKSFYLPNVSLYNKQFFSKNSKVNFFQSSSSRFIKDEKPEIDFHRFTDIAFVRRNRKKSYEFIDKRIKFGETYLYVISAVSTGFFDSEKSLPVTVRIEDLQHPDAPEDVSFLSTPDGILLTIGTRSLKANDIVAFDIFRREEGEKSLRKIDEVVVNQAKFVNFIDRDVLQGKTYDYKVYSRDFFGNLSFWSKEYKVLHELEFNRKGEIPFPDVEIEINSGEVIFRGRKNHSKIIGYRVERKDVWRFEQKFEIKKRSEIAWPNTNLFDKSGSMELIDKTATLGNTYQYRISSIKENGAPASFLITPNITIENGFKFTNKEKEIQKTTTDLINFGVRLEDRKQHPPITRFSWNIEGDWSYIIFEIKKGVGFEGATILEPQVSTFKVDNVHKDNKIYTSLLELKNSYEISAKVFDANDKLLDENNRNQVTRISI